MPLTRKLMKMKSIALLTMALLLAGKAYPYSHDGHYLVGAIADQMLAGTPTAAKVKNLIGSVKLATAANFPDALKGWDPDVTTSSKPFKVTTNKKLNADLKAFLAANQSKPSNCLDLLHHE